jgi:hypothetical protein
MNKEVEQLSQQSIAELLTSLTQAKGFVIEQAPEFCQQMITRGEVDAWLFIILSLAILCALTFLAVVLFKQFKTEEWINESQLQIITVWVIACVIPALWFGVSLTTLITINVAPKVYLVEALMRMIKGA